MSPTCDRWTWSLPFRIGHEWAYTRDAAGHSRWLRDMGGWFQQRLIATNQFSLVRLLRELAASRLYRFEYQCFSSPWIPEQAILKWSNRYLRLRNLYRHSWLSLRIHHRQCARCLCRMYHRRNRRRQSPYHSIYPVRTLGQQRSVRWWFVQPKLEFGIYKNEIYSIKYACAWRK